VLGRTQSLMVLMIEADSKKVVTSTRKRIMRSVKALPKEVDILDDGASGQLSEKNELNESPTQ